jgi:Carboxypeptidase regulatory-like domain/TonB-dependent Receptor Plug Domain/TonB dependent receptor
VSRGRATCLLSVAVLFPFAKCQTTQGVILGRITDAVTGSPIPFASVSCANQLTTLISPAHVDAQGNYAIASLSPGTYTVTVHAAQYQDQQARALELPVAGRVELIFRVRPLYDVWEAGQFRSWVLPESQQALGFYGPDVDTSRVAVFNANRGLITPLDNSRSDVVAATDIQNLPLVGRDVYTMLLLLPGVTSDTATARGLGFSVNGQRPSSSNYLLDGIENNNLLVTGPLSAVIPEFVQEYRVSTTNYSAEYGRTSGFVANAVTRTATNQWHGGAFFYSETDRLNANGFQENTQGIRRAPFTQIQPGLVVSGPLIHKRLFLFAGFQTLRSHGRSAPQTFALPTASFIGSTDPASYAGQLLRKYRPELSPAGTGDSALVSIDPVASFNRTDGLVRIDYSISSSHQLFGRAAWDGIVQPELLFNPYRDFSTAYRQTSLSIAAGLISRFGAASQNELRAGRTGDAAVLQTPHAEVPSLIDDERIGPIEPRHQVVLPGNASTFDYRNRGRNWELLDNWTSILGRHVLKFGGGFLQRTIDLRLAVYPGGHLDFANVNDFAHEKLAYLTVEYDPFSPTLEPVSPDRSYRYRQSYAFAQDSFHVNNRLTIDYGVRYEYFGSPVNTGRNKDLLLQINRSSSIQTSIRHLVPVLPAVAADQTVYTSRPANWAVRAGLAWDPFGKGRMLIRASYGIFYDRLFDNVWENVLQNRYKTAVWRLDQPVSLTAPLAQLEAAGEYQPSSELIPGLAFQPDLRAPRTQSAFVGVQQRLTPDITLEVDALASRARQLITTDQVNRPNSDAGSDSGYLYPNLPTYINYRANQGSSDYTALVSAIRLRKRRFSGQVSYTWSHSIDNQSESLAGTFFDFNTFASAQAVGYQYISSFTRQFASGLDRGNSDFDQRHNLVFFGTYQAPTILRSRRLSGLFRRWTISALGAVRSGLPFTVYALGNYTVSPLEYFKNQRANVIAPDVYSSQPIPGGRLLLNARAFENAGPNVIGTSGRNAFAGPGLFNMDASIARTFQRESLRLTLRADFYNVLNHANLNNPASLYGAPDFGVALYGRREMNNGFPLLAPLNETARQIQVLLRLEF